MLSFLSQNQSVFYGAENEKRDVSVSRDKYNWSNEKKISRRYVIYQRCLERAQRI